MDRILLACRNVLQELPAFIAVAVFVGAAIYGSVGLSALVIAWRVGQ